MKGFVFKSRHTPGLQNATDVGLQIDDRIVHRSRSTGALTGAVVQSKLMQHTTGPYGYECLFDDTGKLGFAGEEDIVDWVGKI